MQILKQAGTKKQKFNQGLFLFANLHLLFAQFIGNQTIKRIQNGSSRVESGDESTGSWQSFVKSNLPGTCFWL